MSALLQHSSDFLWKCLVRRGHVPRIRISTPLVTLVITQLIKTLLVGVASLAKRTAKIKQMLSTCSRSFGYFRIKPPVQSSFSGARLRELVELCLLTFIHTWVTISVEAQIRDQAVKPSDPLYSQHYWFSVTCSLRPEIHCHCSLNCLASAIDKQTYILHLFNLIKRKAILFHFSINNIYHSKEEAPPTTWQPGGKRI